MAEDSILIGRTLINEKKDRHFKWHSNQSSIAVHWHLVFLTTFQINALSCYSQEGVGRRHFIYNLHMIPYVFFSIHSNWASPDLRIDVFRLELLVHRKVRERFYMGLFSSVGWLFIISSVQRWLNVYPLSSLDPYMVWDDGDVWPSAMLLSNNALIWLSLLWCMYTFRQPPLIFPHNFASKRAFTQTVSIEADAACHLAAAAACVYNDGYSMTL